MCKSAYTRMTMLTKLKYVGVPTEDLLKMYILYVRSLLEYCSVVCYSTLTLEQDKNLKNVKKLCLKVVLWDNYNGYENALKDCCLDKLSKMIEYKCLKFGLKSLLHPVHSSMFPVNPQILSNPNKQ
jgi:hypothetical protein